MNKDMGDKISLQECCDVTPLNYEQYELRFDHYITDERTGKKIKLEEPIVIRAMVPVSRTYSPTYVKNETLQRMIWEMNHRLMEGGE